MPFGLFGASVMIECSIKNNGTSSKVKHIIWSDFNLYAKVDWERVLKYVKIGAFSAQALFRGFKLGVQMSFVNVRV